MNNDIWASFWGFSGSFHFFPSKATSSRPHFGPVSLFSKQGYFLPPPFYFFWTRFTFFGPRFTFFHFFPAHFTFFGEISGYQPQKAWFSADLQANHLQIQLFVAQRWPIGPSRWTIGPWRWPLGAITQAPMIFLVEGGFAPLTPPPSLNTQVFTRDASHHSLILVCFHSGLTYVFLFLLLFFFLRKKEGIT